MSNSNRMLSLMLKVGATAGIVKLMIDNSAVILGDELAGPGEVGECFCNRDLTLDECTDILQKLRDSEADVKRASGYSLFAASNCKLPAGDKTIAKFNEKLNQIFTKYDVTTCIRKIHFLAQVYHETDRFRTTKEYATSADYSPYFGRGLMQLTHESNYRIYEAYSGVGCVEDYELIAEDLENAFDSAGWYWKQGKVLSVGQRWTGPSNAPSYVSVHSPNYPKTTIQYTYNGVSRSYGTVDLNLIADNDTVDVISYLVNGGSNGRQERRNYISTLKRIFAYPQSCISKGGQSAEVEANDFGLVQLTKQGNPNIINSGNEDTYTYTQKDGTLSASGQHGDDWIVPEKAMAFSDAVYKLVEEYPLQKIYLGDCSAYNPAKNLGHSATGAHSTGNAFDCRFLKADGSGSNDIFNLTTAEIALNGRFIELLKETGKFTTFYTEQGMIPGSVHSGGHHNHIHGN